MRKVQLAQQEQEPTSAAGGGGRGVTGDSTLRPNYEGWNTSPQPMKMEFLPLELSKTAQITPEAVLKNHSKSHKKS
jgi:hypothetical protein